MGFLLKVPISGGMGNGSFLTPKPSFAVFGDFDPCRGQTHSQGLGISRAQSHEKVFIWGLIHWLSFSPQLSSHFIDVARSLPDHGQAASTRCGQRSIMLH